MEEADVERNETGFFLDRVGQRVCEDLRTLSTKDRERESGGLEQSLALHNFRTAIAPRPPKIRM